jgi:tetratricopeptide (TPR) repeat protein
MLTEEFLGLVVEEELEFKLKDYYQDLMKTFYKLGDFDKAVSYAERALEKAVELSREEDEVTAALKANVAALRKRQQEESGDA